MEDCPTLHYTHPVVAKELLNDVIFNDDDITLEPCVGGGSLYNLIPGKKDWCEIEAGRDFFTYPFKENQFTKVLLNPPYSSNHIKGHKDRKLLTFPFIFKSLELCSDEVWVLLNNNMLNSLTPSRLQRISDLGFGLVFLRVLNIATWSGRYYWICWKKNKKDIISWTNHIELPKNKCECGAELKGDLTAHRKTNRHWANMVKIKNM